MIDQIKKKAYGTRKKVSGQEAFSLPCNLVCYMHTFYKIKVLLQLFLDFYIVAMHTN